MRREELTVYIANDGKRFFSEAEAIKHEEVMSQTKAYMVFHSPDLSTGDFIKGGFAIVQSSGDNELWLEDWLYKKFGSRVAFIKGRKPTENWAYEEIDISDVNERRIIADIRR